MFKTKYDWYCGLYIPVLGVDLKHLDYMVYKMPHNISQQIQKQGWWERFAKLICKASMIVLQS